MDDLWFEEPLAAPAGTIEKGIDPTLFDETLKDIQERARQFARGIVRVQQPRWKKIESPETKFLTSATPARYYAVRLGFEFDLPEDVKRNGVRYVAAKCMAHLWATTPSQPTVYEVLPHEITQGERQKVTLNLAPKLSIDKVVDLSLGEISGDVGIGVVEPICTGFTGKDGREPYWTLKPQGQALIGIRNFWLIVEVPQDCPSFRLAVSAEAQAQGFFGVLPFLPTTGKYPTNESRPSVIIS